MKTTFELKMKRTMLLGVLIFAGLGIICIADAALHPGQSYLPGIVMLLGGLGSLFLPGRKFTPERIRQIESDPITAAANRHPVMFFLFYFSCGVTSMVIFSDLFHLPVDSSFPNCLFKYFMPVGAALGVTIGQRRFHKALKEEISQQRAGGYGSPEAGSPAPQP